MFGFATKSVDRVNDKGTGGTRFDVSGGCYFRCGDMEIVADSSAGMRSILNLILTYPTAFSQIVEATRCRCDDATPEGTYQ